MLIALLLQAAVAAAPPPPVLIDRGNKAEAWRNRPECQRLVVEAMRPKAEGQRGEIVQGASKFEHKDGRETESPVWVPGANREEGYYAAVNRMVDGCPVPTPIYLPNAGGLRR